MRSLVQQLMGAGSMGVPGLTLTEAFLGLLVAFIIGQFIAWIYIYTHHGLSYSRAFVQSIVLLTLIVSMAMLVIGNNIVVAFGLIGALAVIRFRNVLKDTRDTAFIFFALIAGMATGTGRFSVAILGTIIFSCVLVYLFWTSFGSRHISDGFIRFQISGESGLLAEVHEVFKKFCRSTRLVSKRLSPTGSNEIAYRLIMRHPGRSGEMVSIIQEIKGVSNISFVSQEDQAEV
jgi:uncharacterized protein DUF4956